MLPRWNASRLWRSAALCALAAAWALAQGAPALEEGERGGSRTTGNHAPTLTVTPAGGGLTVRAGERITVAVEALDPDVLAEGAVESVWLGVALEPEGGAAAPAWLETTAWSAGPSPRPRLELTFAAPFEAAPGRYVVEAGATDARGLSSLTSFTLSVLGPRCGPVQFSEGDGECRQCPAHHVADGTRTGCEPCPPGTERPAGSASCVPCPAGLVSDAGGACGCGPVRVLADGACVDCPPHTESAGEVCVSCPPDTERPAGADSCGNCVAGETSPGGSACAPSDWAEKHAAPPLSAKSGTESETAVVARVVGVDSAALEESVGRVNVRLTLDPAPAQGTYTGCRLRLAEGSEATSPADVTFANRKKLTADNGWSAQAGFLTVVDDALAEGDEALVVEGYCASSKNAADPTHADLVSRPLRLTIRDNDAAPPLTLTVAPASIGESLGRQTVTVTATLEDPAAAEVTVGLSLGTGAYSVTGTRSVTIMAGARSGSTELQFTPRDDGNTADDTVSISGTASGYAVTGTDLTIGEPVVVDGVDVSGLGVALSVSPTAIREGARGAHRVSATLTGAPVPKVAVALLLAVGGTAVEGASHDYTLKGADGWKRLTVAANDAHLTAGTSVTVNALADTVAEGGETVTFGVSRVTWGTTVVELSEPAVATLSITEAWETPEAPAGLTAAPGSGDERHGLDVAWEAVTATPSVDGYVVRHRAVAAPPASWKDSEAQPGLIAAITGLTAGTRYEVRVRADNAAGEGAESGSVYAYTADGDCTVGAPRVTAAEGARSATELEVSWEQATCAPAATIAHYAVRYREDPDLEKVTNGWSEETSRGLTATLVSLTPDTAYVVEVRAVATGGDNGPWSPTGKGRTGLDTRVPPRVAAPLVAANADNGDTRLDVTWTRVSWTDADDAVHPIADYQYRYRTAEARWTDPTDARAAAAETTTLTRTLAGLTSGTRYEVQVRGVNRMGGVAYPGKWSEPGRGRTWGVPDRVAEPAAYGTGNAVEAVWEAPDDGGSAIDDYDVEYKTADSGGWRTHPYAGCGMDGCLTETTIAAAAKKVRVRAGNAVGKGAWSPTAKVRALQLLRVSFSASSATVAEGESLQVTVRLNAAADRAVTVPLTTTGAAGAFRLDGAANDAVAFALGAREQTFTVAALQDADDDDEKVTLGFGQLPDGVLRRAPSSLTVSIEDDDAGNRSPAFAASTATRTVAENAAAGTAVGAPVAATDADGDTLTYSLAGADAALFAVDAATGQLTVGTDTELDFEGAASRYALTVEVSDGKDDAGAADPAVDASVAVTVTVTDVLEPPAAPEAPAFGRGVRSLPVSWTAPDNTGPAITDYDLAYRAVGATGWTDVPFDGAGTQKKIEGLDAGAAYEVRLRAANAEGAGPWSAPAAANTWPHVRVTASTARPAIGADDAAVAVTLTGTVEAADGDLEGVWSRSGPGGTRQVLSERLALADSEDETLEASSSAPGRWAYSLKVFHTLHGRTDEQNQAVWVEWLPSVVLGVEPARVREGGGAQTVTVTATLTGTSVTDAAKAVTVSVAGGTATAVDDFAAVGDFAIAIPGKARSASATFELTPVADAVDDTAETVSVTGTAARGATALPVLGTAVTITEADPTLTVTSPTNGYVTGVDAAKATVIDCGSGGRTDCTEEAVAGTVITLTATADADHAFGGWTGGCTGTDACTVTLDADATVGATFVALPGKPAAPAAAPDDHATLTVTWSAPSGTGTGIEDYGLRYRKSGAKDWTEAVTGSKATKATLKSLAAGTRYDVQVRAVAAEGAGAWSDTGQAVTLPSVALKADTALPVIGKGDAAAASTLTASATAAEGSLTGRWVQRVDGKLKTVNGEPFAMTSGQDHVATFRSDTPGARTYGLQVSHAPNKAAGEVGKEVDIRWLPSVVLGVEPASVAEDGGAQTVTVTASLTGKAVEDVAKTVTVSGRAGTARAGTDFAAVKEFTIALPAGRRSATGTFNLTPLADLDQEGGETVAVSGTAKQGGTVLPVVGTSVTIDDAVRRTLTVTKPANGRIAGSGIDCGGTKHTDCTATHPEGAKVTLTATAAAGYLLRAWSGDCSGAGDCALTLDGDRTVGATFAPARTLTVTKPANGTVTGTIATKTVIDCGSDCTETAIDGTAVALTATGDTSYALDAWGGACAAETSANCSLTLDADRTVSATFVIGATVGKCHASVVDGCASGTLNATAFGDTDANHHWRCDGATGGANSPKCTKAKDSCTAGSRDWSAGGYACTGSVTAASSGQQRTAEDRGDPTRGSAAFKCDDGDWQQQPGGTCSVALQCGDKENVCLPDGVAWKDRRDMPKQDGACASTESARCLNGTTFRDRPDIPLEHGVCGATTDRCVGGNRVNVPDTTRKNLWRCAGIDAEDHWACLGIDGSKNWQCSYASQTKACGIPIVANDNSCSDITRRANDDDCFTCKTGYEQCGEDCYTPCGGNETRNATTCACVCDDGFHRDADDNCAVNPMCHNPPVEKQCKAGTPADFQNTAIDGVCEAKEEDKCKAGDFKDKDDRAPVYGKCDKAKDKCEAGTPANARMKGGKNLWDCLGIPGSNNWSCLGTGGSKTWNCKSGTQTDACQISAAGADKPCAETVPATAAKDCFSCKSGYEECKKDCHKSCGTNEVRDTKSCKCVCKSGLVKVEESCTEVVKLTVDPVPTKCHITAGAGVAVPPEKADGISCGHKGKTNCVEYYKEGTRVTLTKADKAGYACTWTGDCSGTSSICKLTMNASKRVSASGKSTLDVDPGGDNGAYTATYVRVPLPPPLGWHIFYSAPVTATATGGVPAYSFKWHRSKRAGATATFVYLTPPAGAKEKVTVTDADGEKDTDTATINSPSRSGGQRSDQGVIFELPLGGELYFIWGGEGQVSAKSEDERVVLVGVSSPEIRVSGVGVGETLVEVSTDEGRLYLPVVVR